MKLIDAEKLKAEIERLKSKYRHNGLWLSSTQSMLAGAKIEAMNELLLSLDSLQQEQPEPSCRTCGFYENNCPYIRGKLIPYPSRVCNDYTYSVIKAQQEEKK